jgi:hypothetical protein
MSGPTPEPSELIYAPGNSWAPAILALGLVLLILGSFTVWWWSAIGLLLLLAGARSWWKQSDDEVARMRRSQPLDTAVIPAEPIRRR